ncbi:MAG: dynamin family protein [Planctomycetota bacterium]
MRTLLSRFCEEFVGRLRPLLEPLSKSAHAFRTAAPGTPGKHLEAAALELRHQLSLLSAKVDEQHAYVLIFGPLKSGKSTLMNALAKSYVSEVSALPAYPCLVFVSAADKRHYAITHYDGAVEQFDDPTTLEQALTKGFEDLAERIRRTEGQGKIFDPQQHFQEAVRRVDVRLPATDLAQSGAVLVDTPGLYSRMRFGYDQMTRDFKNAAACAVFVVRSDNLFLDHVFDEFERLLQLFSRIFLIVNVDKTKLDLRPDGTLAPSLEQRDPERIVAAFERLAMSAPLKSASADGRLRIYPIDLLRAASRRIRGAEAEAPADADGFDRFLNDLTAYLESSDYLVAFLGDSLRRADALLDDGVALTDHPDLALLRRKLAESRGQLQDKHAQLAAVERLTVRRWDDDFAKLREELGPVLQQQAEAAAHTASRSIDTAVKGWFKNAASLHDFSKGELSAVLVRYQEDLTAAASKELAERLVRGDAGLQVPPDVARDLESAVIELSLLGREAHTTSDRNALIRVVPNPLRSDSLRVRPTVLQRVTLRRAQAVREKLLGPTEAPVRPIAPKVKATRVPEVGSGMRVHLERFVHNFFRDTSNRIRAGFLDGYCSAVIEHLLRTLAMRREQLRVQIGKLSALQERCDAVLGPLAALRGKVDAAKEALGKLSSQYVRVDPTLLLKPYQLPTLPPLTQKHEPAPAMPRLADRDVPSAPSAPPAGGTTPQARAAHAETANGSGGKP